MNEIIYLAPQMCSVAEEREYAEQRTNLNRLSPSANTDDHQHGAFNRKHENKTGCKTINITVHLIAFHFIYVYMILLSIFLWDFIGGAVISIVASHQEGSGFK